MLSSRLNPDYVANGANGGSGALMQARYIYKGAGAASGRILVGWGRVSTCSGGGSSFIFPTVANSNSGVVDT